MMDYVYATILTLEPIPPMEPIPAWNLAQAFFSTESVAPIPA